MNENTENLPAVRGSLLLDVARFEHAQRVGKMLASSTMIPDHFKNNIGNCVIALNFAERVGIDPFMAMQKMYVIHGKPGIEAQLAIALINRSGIFGPLQYDAKGEGMKKECTAYAMHLETKKELRGQTVSMEMVKAEGWYDKKGSKWKTMPDLMFKYRSAMFFARLYCPEALLGMYSKEELQDSHTLTKQADGSYGVETESGSTDDLNKLLKDKTKETEKETEPENPESETEPNPEAKQDDGKNEAEKEELGPIEIGTKLAKLFEENDPTLLSIMMDMGIKQVPTGNKALELWKEYNK